MPYKIFYLIGFILLLFCCPNLYSQDPLTFEQLSQRIDDYFAPELIADIKASLPKTDYEIWGYDVGDFSGDTAFDFAISIKKENGDKRINDVYFFIDDGGEMKKVFQDTIGYFRLPIEAGLAISDNIVRITQKHRDGDWEVKGYKYRSGILMQVDLFQLERQGSLSRESYRNMQTLESTEQYSVPETNEFAFRNYYSTLPCYSRGRNLNTGYQTSSKIVSSKNIIKGGFNWKNMFDCSFSNRSAYDDEYIYFSTNVKDDEIVLSGPSVPDSMADRIEFWFDSYSMSNRFKLGKKNKDFRLKTDTNIYSFNVSLGDLYNEQTTKVKVSTSNSLDEAQSNAAKLIKAIAMRSDSGYSIKLRIPFAFLGFNKPPLESKPIEYGLTIVVKDIDNPYKQGELTVMASSQNFDQSQPASYGGILFIQDKQYYGSSNNILTEIIRTRLKEVGY